MLCCLVCIYSGICGDWLDTHKSPDDSSNFWHSQDRQHQLDDLPLLRNDESRRNYGAANKTVDPFVIPIHSWYSPNFISFAWAKISFFAFCCFISLMKYCLQFPTLFGIPYDTTSQEGTLSNIYLLLAICINCCTMYWMYWLAKVIDTP